MTYPIDPDNGLLVSRYQTLINPVQKLELYGFNGTLKKTYDAMPAYNFIDEFYILDTFNTGDIAIANYYSTGLTLLLDKNGQIKQQQIVANYRTSDMQAGYYIKDENNILLKNKTNNIYNYINIGQGIISNNRNLNIIPYSTPFFEQDGLVYSFISSGNYPGPYQLTFYKGLIPVLNIKNVPPLGNFAMKHFSPTGDLYITNSVFYDSSNPYSHIGANTVTTYIFKYNIYSNVFSTYYSSSASTTDQWILSNYFIQDIAIDYAGNVYAVMSTSTGSPNITMQIIQITGSSSFSVLATLDSVNDAGNDFPVMSIATLYTNTVEFSKYANVAKTPYPSTIEAYKVIPPDIPIAPIINV